MSVETETKTQIAADADTNGRFGTELGERVIELGAPVMLRPGDVPAIPVGFDRKEVENLTKIDCKMTVESDPESYSVSVEFEQPVVIMPKPNEDSHETYLSKPLDGFVVTIGENGNSRAIGVHEGEEFELFGGLPEDERTKIVDEIATSMAIIDIHTS